MTSRVTFNYTGNGQIDIADISVGSVIINDCRLSGWGLIEMTVLEINPSNIVAINASGNKSVIKIRSGKTTKNSGNLYL